MKMKRHNVMEEILLEKFGDIELWEYELKTCLTVPMTSPTTYPEVSKENIETVPKTEGVCQLLDENNNSVIAIVSTGNLLKCRE